MLLGSSMAALTLAANMSFYQIFPMFRIVADQAKLFDSPPEIIEVVVESITCR